MFPMVDKFIRGLKNKANDAPVVDLIRLETPSTPISNQTEATIGVLLLDGEVQCFTLEPPWRNNEDDSCIPVGEYVCNKYSSSKFPNVWEVQDVPDRSYILIHVGNTESDSSGCIMLGESVGYLFGKRAVLSSRKAIEKFRNNIGNATDKFYLNIRKGVD